MRILGVHLVRYLSSIPFLFPTRTPSCLHITPLPCAAQAWHYFICFTKWGVTLFICFLFLHPDPGLGVWHGAGGIPMALITPFLCGFQQVVEKYGWAGVLFCWFPSLLRSCSCQQLSGNGQRSSGAALTLQCSVHTFSEKPSSPHSEDGNTGSLLFLPLACTVPCWVTQTLPTTL